MTGQAWPLWLSAVGLVGALVVIVVVGRPLVATADELADRTGLGEAVAGGLLLGAITSLPGIGTTITGGLSGDAEFTLANPIGGIAVQSVWLAIADLFYRRANLEHAAASLENILQALVMVALLSLPVIAYATPELRLLWVHPASLLIPIFYGYGLVLVRRMRRDPMWRAKKTDDTKLDVPETPSHRSTTQLWWRLAALAVVVAGTGYVIGQSGLGIIAGTGLPSGLVGFTLTTVVTSMPELITLVVAVRMGALTLGVGNILGGNIFDSLMIPLADASYLPGPIYAAAGPAGLLLAASTILITAVLCAGLVLRERKGIGFEGVAIPCIYAATVALLITLA